MHRLIWVFTVRTCLMVFSTPCRLYFFLSFCLYIQVSLNMCTDAHQNNIILRSACAAAWQDKRFSSAREKFHFLILHLGKLGRLDQSAQIWRLIWVYLNCANRKHLLTSCCSDWHKSGKFDKKKECHKKKFCKDVQSVLSDLNLYGHWLHKLLGAP